MLGLIVSRIGSVAPATRYTITTSRKAATAMSAVFSHVSLMAEAYAPVGR
jgi:hypothetical protein